MFQKNTQEYAQQIQLLADKICQADAIVVGAASGMSAAAGHSFYYQPDAVFKKYCGDYEKKYGFHGTFNGYYHRYPKSSYRWAFIAQFVQCIEETSAGKPYEDILEILKGRSYHILTTNQDALFNRSFPEEKISAIQGDWRFLQCSRRCKDELYDAVKPYEAIRKATDADLNIPDEYIPRCPHCGAELEPWVRGPVFLEGKRYRDEYEKLNRFLEENQKKNILFWELGVGRMTPMFIQEPFWNLTWALPKAYYVTVNPKDALLPRELKSKGMAIHQDIARVMADLRAELQKENLYAPA